MAEYYGDFPTSFANVCMVFDSFAAATGAPAATSNFAAGDILIYKNGGTTQRSSANGITVSTTFDSQTGLQMVIIDLSDNTDAGFYAAGNEYQVGVADVTIDGQTVRFWLGTFSIQRAGGVLALIKAGTIKVDVDTIKTNPVVNAGTVTFPTTATLASTTNITAGTVTTATNVTNVNGIAANVITATALATSAVDEIVDQVWDEAIAGHLSAGSTGLALNSAGAAGDPWSTAIPGAYGAGTAGHIVGTALPDIAPGSANGLLRGGTNAATSITTALTANIIGNVTGNLSGSVGSVTGAVGSVTGAVGSVTGNVGGNVVGSVASVTGNVGGNVTGSVGSVVGAVGSVTGAVGSVTGAVGSVTGNVGGNVVGTVASVVGAVGSVTGNVGGNVVGTVASMASAGENSMADAFLNRNMATGTDSGSTTVRTPRQALRFLRNFWQIAGGTLTVYKEDDATSSWTGAVVQTAGNPVSEINPAGP